MDHEAGSSKLYEQVADRLAALIDSDALRAGERVPSVRSMSIQQRVSVSTVLQAYQVLEDRGLIETRPQSGHYVRVRPAEPPREPEIPKIPQAATLVSVSDLIARVRRASADPHLVPLGAGVVSTDLLPVKRLNRMMADGARRAEAAGVRYGDPCGYRDLRRQIARRSLEWGSVVGPDEIVITAGAREAIQLCLMAVAKPGDTIAIESPSFYATLQLIESLKMKAVEIPVCSRNGPSVEAIEQAIRRFDVRALILTPNFNNPLGSLMPEASKRKLIKLLAKEEVPLIEDDIYGDLYFGETRPLPAKAFDKKGMVMLCSSFSKTLAPGYRVGWAIPGKFLEQVLALKFIQSGPTSTLPQLAIAEFLDGGGYDRHLRSLRRLLAGQVERISAAVADHFPAGTRLSRPAGGFLLWVELPGRASALELHALAQLRGISISPGPIFSAKQRFQNAIRLNCGSVWSETIERAIKTLGGLAKELAGEPAAAAG